jgi:predicted RNase H-like nuclease (RuvC/YqgF family)
VAPERNAWTDERLDERMNSIDRTLGLLQDDVSGLRSELGEFRREVREDLRALRADFSSEMQHMRSEFAAEMRLLRSDVTSVQDRLVQIGFGLVGVLVVALSSLVVAVV